VRRFVTWLVLLAACTGAPTVSEDKLEERAGTRAPQSALRVFYSGHSLSDGVPEAMSEIAQSLHTQLDFEFQSVGYSLLRERTAGSHPSQPGSGYRSGKNREGEGLDVRQELTRHRYDALVVTERHDLPEVAAEGQTATHLADFARHALTANAESELYFYHTWLPIDAAAPERWVAYERGIRQLWECVASRANRTLGQPRLQVLPGATALAALVEALHRGQVPGSQLSTRNPAERVGLLFRDSVHLSPLGTYFMGLVHYAALFARSPAGALSGPGIDAETAAFFQQLAARHVADYTRIAASAASRDMGACRSFAADQACALYHSLVPAEGLLEKAKQKAKIWRCGRLYSGASNPFSD
jgi:hypothetical protein